MTLYGGQAVAKEVIVVDNATAEGITSTLDRTTSMAIIDCEGGDCRYYVDGSTPTALLGHPLLDGGGITLVGRPNIENFRVIAQDGGGATLTVTIMRGGTVK